MFREMRRFKQALPKDECEQILKNATSGVLAVTGDDGYPYTVPVSHVYENGKIYFHCAKEGHKFDGIQRCDKVSFCVIAQDKVMPKERTTAYISVIAFGRAAFVDDEPGMRHVCSLIGEKFSPDYLDLCQQETDEMIAAKKLCCVAITVEHMTGKCGREVMLERQKKAQGANA